MPVRMPVVAGRFYPAEAEACRRQATELVACRGERPGRPLAPSGRLWGGVVPHAGWMFSGRVAGAVIGRVARQRRPETVVIFGAVHVRMSPRAAVYPDGRWETPVGDLRVDAELAGRIAAEAPDLLTVDAEPHEYEHSIEVEAPLVHSALPEARLVAVMVPPGPRAADVGRAVGRACRAAGADVAFFGSSDLTHYGPAYDMTPHGRGPTGLRWAREVNDRRLIDLMLALDAEGIDAEVRQHHNACGAGAIAATIAACREMGADTAVLAEHTSSAEVLRALYGQDSEDAVGYAGVLFVEAGS